MGNEQIHHHQTIRPKWLWAVLIARPHNILFNTQIIPWKWHRNLFPSICPVPVCVKCNVFPRKMYRILFRRSILGSIDSMEMFLELRKKATLPMSNCVECDKIMRARTHTNKTSKRHSVSEKERRPKKIWWNVLQVYPMTPSTQCAHSPSFCYLVNTSETHPFRTL